MESLGERPRKEMQISSQITFFCLSAALACPSFHSSLSPLGQSEEQRPLRVTIQGQDGEDVT